MIIAEELVTESTLYDDNSSLRKRVVKNLETEKF
jgi:hypothetical protein